MKGLIEEILQIPVQARICFEKYSKENISLPQDGTLYVGMGSSYFAAQTLYFCGAQIHPILSSELFYYLSPKTPHKLGVLVSQSGESSETVWNLSNFESIVAITNNKESTIAKSKNTKQVILIEAGPELCSSTKTYINTLIVLYMGFGFQVEPAITKLESHFEKMRMDAQEKAQQIFSYLNNRNIKGRTIIGSGPNMATAQEASLTFSETTRMAWSSMSVASYDHGFKESSDDTILIILNSHGKDAKRISLMKDTLKQSGSTAQVIELVEGDIPEYLSPITFIAQLNLIMNYLADLMTANLGQDFVFKIGGKVTIVEK